MSKSKPFYTFKKFSGNIALTTYGSIVFELKQAEINYSHVKFPYYLTFEDHRMNPMDIKKITFRDKEDWTHLAVWSS